MTDCPHCKGRGKKTAFYNEVLGASGPFYDQDVVREIRTITVNCRACNGTGKAKEAKENERQD